MIVLEHNQYILIDDTVYHEMLPIQDAGDK